MRFQRKGSGTFLNDHVFEKNSSLKDFPTFKTFKRFSNKIQFQSQRHLHHVR
jgi:hypothetical protein